MGTSIERRGRTFAQAALAIITATMLHMDYWGYSQQEHANPEIWRALLRGEGTAPSQYRVGVVRLAYFLTQHSHLAMRHAFEAIDVAASFACVFMLLHLLRRSSWFGEASAQAQLVSLAVFVALVQFQFAWVVFYQRPETLPTAMILASVLLLLSRRFPFAARVSDALTVVLLLALAALQGFMRADVAFALHGGILLFCLSPRSRELSLPRSLQVATSVAGLLVAGGIQIYLMRVAYPHANYGDTPVLQLWGNLGSPGRYVALLLFLPPYFFLATWTFRRWSRVAAPSLALLAGSAIYFCLWIAVGKTDEIRIFLPFSLVLAPATAAAMAAWLMPRGSSASNAFPETADV